MNLVKRSNYIPTSSSFFDDFLTKDLFDWSGWTDQGGSVPRVNIVETNEDFRVEMAVPGMKKEDFHLELDNDMLTIQSDAGIDDAQMNGNLKFTRKEFDYGSFKRSFFLPNTVEMDSIEAKYQDGILRLLIPKKEEARKKPIKTIAIT